MSEANENIIPTGLNIFDDNRVLGNQNCSICLSEIDDETVCYTIQECNHKYHTNCLIQWFRTSHNVSCPLCRHVNTSGGLTHHERKTRFSLISNYSRRKNANILVKRMVKRYRTQQQLLKKYRKQLSMFEKNNKDILKTHTKFRRLVTTKNWKLSRLRNQISSLPIIPLYFTKVIHRSM